MRIRRFFAYGFFLALSFNLYGQATPQRPAEKQKPGELAISSGIFKNLEWRNIGPAIMVGRVADIEGVPGNPNIVYVGSASGGIWKTVNGGISWKSIFDSQDCPSIGDIALEPGNPDVIYVGTGEGNPRNSVSFGAGVYKSTDGGQTWTHLGLSDTRYITRIVINPRNPQVVYVGALGHIYGPNKERGVFLSTDGGKNWEKVLYTDDRHGVADMDIDAQNPNILYAALWHFQRRPWTFTSGDEEGGVFKSVDGGRSWKKLTQGLPKLVGRIGIKASPSNPQVLYAITEAKEGMLYRSDDRGETFRLVSKDLEIVSRGFYYTDLRVDPSDENRVYAVSSRLSVSIDGGRTFRRISPSTHVDFHALWIDPQNPGRIWQGQDGGIAVTYDRGQTWEYVNNICAAQFYQVYADNRSPFYYVGGGLQDNGTWYSPSRNRDTFGILNDDWRMISFGDGFHIVSHPDNPDLFLSENQGGGVVRTDMKTLEQHSVSPQPRRADGAPASTLKYRFNWNTPIIASTYDQKIVYLGANVIFRSPDFGLSWEVISPDLTTNNPEKLKTAGGPPWPENTTAEYHCTIISLAESPFQRNVLWAGSDDGNLQVTVNGGRAWENVIKNVPGVPEFSPVSHIEPSWAEAGTAYCAFDRHMFDDLKPYVYKTKDFGKTWTSITGNLPENAHIWVVREDPENPRLLYAGTELGLFVSYMGGGEWTKLHMKSLPTVAVHDILVHPRENDLILGTHGRGIWIFDDITPIQQLGPAILSQPAHLFDIRPALRFAQKSTRYGIGDKVFRGQNPPYGALITYYLKEKPAADKAAAIEILDSLGKEVRKIARVPLEPGLNRIAWDLRSEAPRPRREEVFEEDFFFRGPRGPQVLPGTYTVRLTLEGQVYEKPVEVRVDPTVSVTREELRIAQEYCLKLRDMQSYLNDGLRALDNLRVQLEERKKSAEALGSREMREGVKVISKFLEQMDELQNSIARPQGRPYWSEGPRLLEKVSSLFNSLDQVNAAPTSAQVEYFGELAAEFKEAMSRANDYLSSASKELSSALNRHKLPQVIVPDLIKVPKI